MQSDLFKHIEMFKLNDEYNKFISDMNSLGLVYDFNEESLSKSALLIALNVSNDVISHTFLNDSSSKLVSLGL